ncbi:MAG: hypothetical protein EVB08_07990 [Synechococcus sp. MED-G135]|nr:MAG: hypothetical protein EVB08_07990 [Synechococcus sp. MED-G135]
MITDQLLKQIQAVAVQLQRPICSQDIRRTWMATSQLTEQKAKACFHTLEMLGAGATSTDGSGTMLYRAVIAFD